MLRRKNTISIQIIMLVITIRKAQQIKVNAIGSNLIFVGIFTFFLLWMGEWGLILITLIFWMPLISIRAIALGFVMSRLKAMKLGHAKMILMSSLFVYWLIFSFIIYLYQPVLSSWTVESYVSSKIVGYTLLILAWFFYLWAIYTIGWERLMRIQELSESKGMDESKLVVTGPYTIVRHPVYLFELFILISVFLITGVLSILLLFLICLFVAYPIIYLEEKELKERFGGEYDNYAKKVGRLFPKVVYRRGS